MPRCHSGWLIAMQKTPPVRLKTQSATLSGGESIASTRKGTSASISKRLRACGRPTTLPPFSCLRRHQRVPASQPTCREGKRFMENVIPIAPRFDAVSALLPPCPGGLPPLPLLPILQCLHISAGDTSFLRSKRSCVIQSMLKH
jgi:hypothetical protein